jgi:3-oxoacyl-[acyl-carrier protein] reductase
VRVTVSTGCTSLLGVELGIEARVALVLGASKGIGRGIAAALAREGARVAMASRSLENLAEAAAEIDGETAAFEADTADLERMAALPGDVEATLGGRPTRASCSPRAC